VPARGTPPPECAASPALPTSSSPCSDATAMSMPKAVAHAASAARPAGEVIRLGQLDAALSADFEQHPTGSLLLCMRRRFGRMWAEFSGRATLSSTASTCPQGCDKSGAVRSACPGARRVPAMCLRSELMMDRAKEAARALRRVDFDFNYWANMRSSARSCRSLLTIPASRILRSVLLPVAFVTGIAALTTQRAPGWVPAPPAWTSAYPLIGSEDPLKLTSPFLVLLLIFRSNNAAARATEASKLIGSMLTCVRVTVRIAMGAFPRADVHGAATFVRWLCAFTVALRCHVQSDGNLVECTAGLLVPQEQELLMTATNKVRTGRRKPVHSTHAE
jgi:Bestrophin, RFP-TM, chloride channel